MDELILKHMNHNVCSFCGLEENNELKYGKLYNLDNVTAHYYCVLFSNNIQQHGADNEGILGFLLPDIHKELKRSKKIICCYCKKGHATIKCCKLKCEKTFHLPCGLKNKSLHQFFEDFKNYCFNHKPIQNIPKKILKEFQNSSNTCSICFDEVETLNWENILWAPCCKKNLYHKKCIQQLALSEGYLFKCAICNNKTKFKKYMLRFGIFIPLRDASWELVPQAFEELLFKYNRCDAEECKNPIGRQKNIEDTIWEIILCKFCGSQGIHIACGNLKFSNPYWECKTCTKIINSKLNNSNDFSLNDTNFYKKNSEEFIKDIPCSSSNSYNNIKPNKAISQNVFQSKKRKMTEEESLVSEKRQKYFFDSEDSEEFVDVETIDLPEVKSKASSLTRGAISTSELKPLIETKSKIIEIVELTDSDDDDDDVKVIKEIHKEKKNLKEEKIKQLLHNEMRIIEIQTCISFCNKEEEITKERALVTQRQRLWQHKSMFYLKQ